MKRLKELFRVLIQEIEIVDIKTLEYNIIFSLYRKLLMSYMTLGVFYINTNNFLEKSVNA